MHELSTRLSKPLAEVMRLAGAFLFLATYVQQDASGTLIVKPQNHAVMIGQEFTLACQTNETVKLQWNGHISGSPKEAKKIVYSGYVISPHAASFSKRISDVVGDFSLLIRATKEAAMNYECLEPGSLHASSAAVTIVEPDPICNTSWGEDVVETTCFIDFQGDWAPTMEWRRCDGNDETSVPASVSKSLDRVTSNITRKRNGSNNSVRYKVTIYFKEDGRPPGIDANNIPLYSHSTYVNESSCMHCLSEKRYDNTFFIITRVVLPIIAAVVVAISIIVVVYCCCCRKKCKKSRVRANGNLLPMGDTTPDYGERSPE